MEKKSKKQTKEKKKNTPESYLGMWQICVSAIWNICTEASFIYHGILWAGGRDGGDRDNRPTSKRCFMYFPFIHVMLVALSGGKWKQFVFIIQ